MDERSWLSCHQDRGVVEIAFGPLADGPLRETHIGELASVLESVVADPTVRLAVLRGGAKRFFDPLDLGLSAADPLVQRARIRQGRAVLERIEALPCPVLFAGRGDCVGPAFELMLACDVAVAAENARLGLPGSNRGFPPALGGAARLAARSGSALAARMLYMGRLLTGAEAADAGLIVEAIPEEAFESRLRRIVACMRQGRRPALARIKHAMQSPHSELRPSYR